MLGYARLGYARPKEVNSYRMLKICFFTETEKRRDRQTEKHIFVKIHHVGADVE